MKDAFKKDTLNCKLKKKLNYIKKFRMFSFFFYLKKFHYIKNKVINIDINSEKLKF